MKKLIIRNSAGEPQFVVGVIEDVTARKQSEARIARLAHYDALTGLPNRVFFREQLAQPHDLREEAAADTYPSWSSNRPKIAGR